MGRKTLRALVWHLNRLGRSLNWPSLLALGLLAVEAGFYFSTVVPVLDERARLRARILAQHDSADRASQPAPVNTDPRVDLAKFYAALAQPSNTPDLLRRLHLRAHDQGLSVQQAEYHPVPDPEGKFLRYQIVLPVKGTYPEIRRFLAEASRELPGLAVDSINFQRQHIGDPIVEAQIKLTLFLGAPS